MSKSRSLLAVSIVGTALIARIGSDITADLSYLLLSLYAFAGRGQALQALALSWLFTMLNPGLVADASYASIGRYIVLISAALSVCIRVPSPGQSIAQYRAAKNGVNAVFFLGGFFVIHALFVSPAADVSVLKAVSWALTTGISVIAWGGLNWNERDDLIRALFGGLVWVAILSLPLLGSFVGYLVNGTGFQGVLNHPQAFGSTMALVGAWAFARTVASVNPSWASIAVTAICAALVVLSEARTAGLALALGCGLAIVSARRLSGLPLLTALPGLGSGRLHFTIAMALIGIAMAGAGLIDRVEAFILKRSGTSNVTEIYAISRGELMEQMWGNIQEKPYFGIGFGVASEPWSMEVIRDPVLGLPLSAAVEKGVMPLAVLEEVGLVGFAAVTVWIWTLFRRSAFGGAVPFTVCTTALILNLGEATLFSPGGMGLLILTLLGWSSTHVRPPRVW